MKRAAAPLLLLLAAGCWVPLDRGRQMEDRIGRLEEENRLAAKQLDEQRALLRERIAEADEKIREVQSKLDELNHAARRTGADLGVEVDKLRGDLASLRGGIEENQHNLQQTEQELTQLKSDTDARFAALKGTGALDLYEAQQKVAKLQLPADKVAFFQLAQSQDKSGQKDVARLLYQDFTKKWPTDPRAADAWFRIGEIQFGAKRYQEAVLAYGKVVEGFPRSDKVPDAMFRTGESMQALGLPQDAKGIFAEVARRFPKTTVGEKARARLAEGKRRHRK